MMCEKGVVGTGLELASMRSLRMTFLLPHKIMETRFPFSFIVTVLFPIKIFHSESDHEDKVTKNLNVVVATTR